MRLNAPKIGVPARVLLPLALSLFVLSTGCSSTIDFQGKALKAISLSPDTASVATGAAEQFIATATYSDGSTAVVTSTANWRSSNAAAATVSSSGVAIGVNAGATTVTAAVGGISGTAALSVTPKTVTAISISPAAASVATGATEQFSAMATYSDGSTAIVTTTASWTSSSAAVATINSSGLATGIAAGSTTVTSSLGGLSGTATLSVAAQAATVTAVAVTPSPASFAMGATQQFTATATYSDGSTAIVTATASWSVANTSVATIDNSGLATAVASGSSTITASQNGVSGNSSITVTQASSAGVSVSTWHFDNNRSGLNASEATLSTSNVGPQTFGKLFSYLLDGYAYGEPLLVSNVTVNGNVHNVLYVATERDSVYALDADNYGAGAPLWQVSLLQPGETPITDGVIQPYQGVTSTPVIDLNSNTIYVVSEQTAPGSGASFRLNALDITTGAQKFGGPVTISASVPGTNSASVDGVVNLTTSCLQRAALLLANGSVYMGFGSCHSGWLLAYNAQTLAQTGVFNSSPNLNGEGQYGSAGGVWMGSGGPDADSAGNVYITTGNGPWDGQTAFADSVLRFNATLQLQDYFTPQDYQYMDCDDADLAAGGLLLIPGSAEAVAGGKTGKLYVVNTRNLGQMKNNDSGATQTLWFEPDLVPPYSSSCTDNSGTHTTNINSYEIFGTSAYFNGSIYLGITPTAVNVPAGIRQFTYSAASGTLTPGTYTSPSIQENTRGTTPFISSNGTSNGILWMIDTGQPLQNSGSSAPTSAILRAYDATDLSDELYNSGANPSDVPGYGIKFSSPIVANGKVYISTGHDLTGATNPEGEIDIYGLN